jgi:hypothetical protein
MLTVTDEFTRRCLVIIMARKRRSDDVLHVAAHDCITCAGAVTCRSSKGSHSAHGPIRSTRAPTRQFFSAPRYVPTP